MAGFKHGVYTSEVPTQLLPPVTVDSNVVFAVGTAAVDTLDSDKPRYVNKLRCYFSYGEFVAEMGWDAENFSEYSLQELIYSHFALYRGAPIICANVYDPSKHKTTVTNENVVLKGDVGTLKNKGISNVKVVAPANGANPETNCVAGTDYTVNLVAGTITRKIGGAIAANATIKVSYEFADISKVTSADIIGGIDANGDATGLELVDSVFPLYRKCVGSILCPKFGEDPAVAVVMAAKAHDINGLFQAIAIVDIPSSGSRGVTKYTEVPAYKQNNNLSDERLIVCWPKVKLGNNVYGLATHLTGLMSQVDSDNGDIPYASASNKHLNITSIGLVESSGKWKEISLGMDKVNYLNGEGIFSALNWIGGLRTWGGRMSCYPGNTDPKDCQEPIRRMFNWYQNTFILTYFQKVDAPMTRRLIQTILRSENIRLEGYTSREIILGGRIAFEEKENPIIDLIDGIIRFHLYFTPPPAAREIDCAFEFDTENLAVLFD